MGSIAKAVSSGVVFILVASIGGCALNDPDPFNTAPASPTTIREEPSIRPNSNHQPECQKSDSITFGPTQEWNPLISVASEWGQPTLTLQATDRFVLVGAIVGGEEAFGYHFTDDNDKSYIGRIMEPGTTIHFDVADFNLASNRTEPFERFEDLTLCAVVRHP